MGTLAQWAGADVTAYFFGEENSDAGAAAGSVADRLGLPLLYLGANRELHRHFADCIRYQPLADLEWAKYVTGRHRLPAYDSLWSGRLGDHLLAESETLLIGPDDDRLLAEVLFRRFAHESPDRSTREAIVDRIASQLAGFGGSTAQRRQAFSYYAHERSVQHCGLFHDFGRHPHFSPFEDIDVVEAALGIPPSWRARNNLYRLVMERHFPQVSEAAVPVDDRRNGHKPLEHWLRGNDGFSRAVLHIVSGLDGQAAISGDAAGLRSSLDAILAGRSSRREIHTFFRHLTVAAFVTAYLT